MKHKYIIPLVLCGLMIACTAPAFAETHDITSGTSQKFDSELLNGPTVTWVTTNYWTNPGVDSGDTITWKDYKFHNAPSIGAQYARSNSSLNGVYGNSYGYGDWVSFGDEAFRQVSRTAMYGGQTLYVFDTYEGVNKATSWKSVI